MPRQRAGRTALRALVSAAHTPLSSSNPWFPEDRMKLDIPDFAHHRLHVFEPAMEIAVAAKRISSQLSSSEKRIGDQLSRASVAIPLLIGEGANRATTGRKRQRFSEARGETGEVAVALELLIRMGLLSEEEGVPLIARCAQVGKMLTGLIKANR